MYHNGIEFKQRCQYETNSGRCGTRKSTFYLCEEGLRELTNYNQASQEDLNRCRSDQLDANSRRYVVYGICDAFLAHAS